MIDKTQNYLQNISLLRQLQPIMLEMGVEADGYVWIEPPHKVSIAHLPVGCHDVMTNTWSTSTMELLLPEFYWGIVWLEHGESWVKDQLIEDFNIGEDLAELIVEALHQVSDSRNMKEKAIALAKLIILLKQNGLLEGANK